MIIKKRQAIYVVGRCFGFLLRALGSFRRNQRLLISGSAVYYTLLSIVPKSALASSLLPHFIEEHQ